MRILIVSDIHANWPALRAIEERADAVFFLGDAVNYGPNPQECVQWLRRNATYAVKGNHDEFIAKGFDPRCSAPYRRAAAEVGRIHAGVLGPNDKAFLGGLPIRERVQLGETTFGLVHASPSQPLYGYRTEDQLAQLLPSLGIDVLLVGHTHLPFVRRVGSQLLINPGSVGQPKDGDPRASCAIWEDGEAEIRRVEYDIEEAIAGIRNLDLPIDVQEFLTNGLRTGGKVRLDGLPLRLTEPIPREMGGSYRLA
jgi:protein phosphatase